METVKIGGVPEHFNLPWQLAIEEGLFKSIGLDVTWKDYPAGTGAMCKDLRTGDLDIAVVLTEGIVADIINGSPSKLIQWYVKTPLIWGIHTSCNNRLSNLSDILGKKYAISRKGSGSHLMAFVDATMRGVEIYEEQLVLVENMEGARQALKDGKADLFLWEKFMTKPLVDDGEFKRLGERPTPWPCFVIAATNNFLESHPGKVSLISDIILPRAQAFKEDKNAAELIVQKFNLKKTDAIEWLQGTIWANGKSLDKDILQNVIDTLYKIKIVNRKPSPEELCESLTTNL